MSIRTSSQNGNWNDTTTWGGAAVPGDGDQVVINHLVAVTENATIGTSPAEASVDYAITVNANSGKLTVNTGVTLTVRGPVLMHGLVGGGGDIQLNAGSTWKWDASLATDPTNQNYRCVNGDSSVALNPIFKAIGTSGSRVTITSEAAGGNGYFTSTAAVNGGNYDWDYVRAQRLGAAATPAIECAGLSDASVTLAFDNCIFENCGAIKSTGIQTDVDMYITNNSFRGSLARPCDFTTGGSFNMLGDRDFRGNVFDKAPRLPIDNANFDGCIFLEPNEYAQGYGRAISYSNVFIRMPTGFADVLRSGNWDGNYMVCDGSTLDLANKNYSATADFVNPHWTTPVGIEEGTYRVDRTIFEDFGSNGEGDIDYGANVANFHSIFEYCIVLPSQKIVTGAALNAGTMATLNGWNGANCQYNHNTFFSGGQGFLALAEAGNGFANMITSAKSNIVWNHPNYSAAGFNYFAYYPTSPAGAVNDQISVGGATDNCMFGVRSDGSDQGPGNTNGHYEIRGTTTYGANDVYEDPGFVDPTRNFTTWITALLGGVHPLTGSPTRYDWNSYGLYLLSLVNDTSHADYNPSATLANLKAHVRGGFAPTNVNLQDAGHDAITIGAVEMAAVGGGAPGFRLGGNMSAVGIMSGGVL